MFVCAGIASNVVFMHTPPRKNANKCNITKLAKCQNLNVEKNNSIHRRSL
jgi:hypothetical protein